MDQIYKRGNEKKTVEKPIFNSGKIHIYLCEGGQEPKTGAIAYAARNKKIVFHRIRLLNRYAYVREVAGK
jgi:hypothetical protein